VKLARRNARLASVENAVAWALRDLLIRFVPQRMILQSLVAIGRPPGPAG
jgi:hypothetical protein